MVGKVPAIGSSKEAESQQGERRGPHLSTLFLILDCVYTSPARSGLDHSTEPLWEYSGKIYSWQNLASFWFMYDMSPKGKNKKLD